MIELTDTNSAEIAAEFVRGRMRAGSPAMGMVMTLIIVVAEEDAETVDESAEKPGVESIETSEAVEAVENVEADAELARPVVPSFSVLFQAPDTEAALSAPSRRRRAQAPAAAVPPRPSEGQAILP